MSEMTPAEVAAAIDHTLLRPEATRDDIVRLCLEARQYGFAGVCVAGSWLTVVVEALRGSGVKAVAVAGFPLGTATTRAKAFEVDELADRGADEIDTVIHLGHVKSGTWGAVGADLAAVVAAAGRIPVKVILETGLLSASQICRAADLAAAAGAAYVKTATGFLGPGATVEAVRLLTQTVGDRAKVKASGGIKTLEQARAMLAAGADRLGTSASVQIVAGT